VTVFDHFQTAQQLLKSAVPYADQIVASVDGRRRATELITENFEHIPADLLAHQIAGAGSCEAEALMAFGSQPDAWNLDAERIRCPVRIVWGTADRLLAWPSAAERYRREWLPQADWVELEGVGHCPQLDVPTEVAQLILDFTR
jgi:pimeloyl-ACP methyl ester carboxylesterase